MPAKTLLTCEMIDPPLRLNPVVLCVTKLPKSRTVPPLPATTPVPLFAIVQFEIASEALSLARKFRVRKLKLNEYDKQCEQNQ